jgi:hypothetical protein
MNQTGMPVMPTDTVFVADEMAEFFRTVLTVPETAAVLHAAADRIERQGWNVGDYSSNCYCPAHVDSVRLCALGAINVAAGLTPNGARMKTTLPLSEGRACIAIEALADAVHSPCADDTDCYVSDVIGDWNDAEGRTAGQVMDQLRRTADELTSNSTAPTG